MDKKTHKLLLAVDDPVEVECPPELDSPALHQRIIALQPLLDRIAGQNFLWDDKAAQDCSFFGDLTIQLPGPEPKSHWINTLIAIRFSNFGSLFTTWNHGPDQLPEPVIALLLEAVTDAGFHHIPSVALSEPYSGRNPKFLGGNWWNRYFDYIS